MLDFVLSNMAGIPIKTFARKTLAGFMAVWLSGFVFLFCAIGMHGEPVSAESASMDGMSGHCKKAMAAKSAKNAGDAVERAAGDNVDCCGFLPAVFDKNRKLERIEKSKVVSTQPAAVRFNAAPVGNQRPIVVTFNPYIPDRQYTFIKNRVFRI